MIPFSRCIESRATAAPDSTAILFRGRYISYAELANRIVGFAKVLQNDFGIKEGDRIAWLGQNSPRVIEALFACAQIGAILVPLNWRLAVPELVHVIIDAGAGLLIVGTDQVAVAEAMSGQLENCQPVHAYQALQTSARSATWPAMQLLQDRVAAGSTAKPVQPDAPVLILYTSGTTGKPKGVVLTQAALAWSARNSVAMHTMTKDDRILMVLPMFHAGGFNIQTLPALSVGATVILEDGFDPGGVLRQITHSRPTLTGLVPAQIQAMVEHCDWAETDISSLRSITTGSTFVPEACIAAWVERGVTALQVYGATETCAVAIHQDCDNAAATAGSVGYAAKSNSIRIVNAASRDVQAGEHGEILVKGPSVFKAYWNDPPATAGAVRDGWYHTGDIGFQRPDGSYVISGRKADLIISGGENIYPAELEGILVEHPDIAEAAVVGFADDRWGEVPVAVIVLVTGSRLDRDQAQRLFEGRLARFKHPKRVMIVPALPRNAMGKVDKAELYRQISAQREP